jgi:hypothetical protein
LDACSEFTVIKREVSVNRMVRPPLLARDPWRRVTNRVTIDAFDLSDNSHAE